MLINIILLQNGRLLTNDLNDQTRSQGCGGAGHLSFFQNSPLFTTKFAKCKVFEDQNMVHSTKQSGPKIGVLLEDKWV